MGRPPRRALPPNVAAVEGPTLRPTHGLGAASVIVDGSTARVLLVRHNYGRRNWEIPGGVSQAGESAEQTARREVREELGVEIEIEAMTGIYWEPDWGGIGGHHFVFRVHLAAGALPQAADPNEIADLGWFSAETFPRPLSDFTMQRVRDALAGGPVLLHTVRSRTWLA